MLTPKLIAYLALVALAKHEAFAKTNDHNDKIHASQTADINANEERVNHVPPAARAALASHTLGVFHPSVPPATRAALASRARGEHHPHVPPADLVALASLAHGEHLPPVPPAARAALASLAHGEHLPPVPPADRVAPAHGEQYYREPPPSAVAREALLSDALGEHRPPINSDEPHPFGTYATPSLPLSQLGTTAKVNAADIISAGRVYHEWKNEEEMMSIIEELILFRFNRLQIFAAMKASPATIELIKAGINKWTKNFSKQIQQTVQTWWIEGMSLADVCKLAMVHVQDYVISYAYFEYGRIFTYRSARLKESYEEWLFDGVIPDDASKKLAEEYPGEGKMTVKYIDDYKRLYEIHQNAMDTLRKSLKEELEWHKVRSLLSHVETMEDSLINTMIKRYDNMYKRGLDKVKLWRSRKEDGVTPDDLRRTLGLDGLQGSALAEHQNYPEYLQYRKWYDFAIRKELAERLKKGMDPDALRSMLFFDNVEDSVIRKHYNYPFYEEYIDKWIDTYLKEALKKCMRKHETPHDVFEMMKLAGVDESDKKIPYYVKYFNWWIETHPGRALELWLQEGQHLYYVRYLEWWQKLKTKQILQK